MDITYLGGGSIKISGKNINIVCDPYDESAGLGNFRAKADVVTLSGPEGFGEVQDAMVFDRPGEYEVRGARITGGPAQLHIDEDGHRGTVFSFLVDGINVAMTGNIDGNLDESQLENLGSVDVLVVPVGNSGLTLDAEGAAAVVAQIEPGYVVPIHYDDGKSKYPMPQAKVDEFLKEMGASPEPQTKLKFQQKEPTAETQVVLLTPAFKD